jgi:hypothetical protein
MAIAMNAQSLSWCVSVYITLVAQRVENAVKDTTNTSGDQDYLTTISHVKNATVMATPQNASTTQQLLTSI